MFYNILDGLCVSRGTTVTAVLKELKLSPSKGTAWRGGSIPNGAILAKLAAYFNVTTDYLLGIENPPAITDEGKLPENYYQLNDANKAIVDRLIADLANNQSKQ